MLDITNVRKTLFVITGSREVRSVNRIRDLLSKKLKVTPIDLYECQFRSYRRYGFMNRLEKEELYELGKHTMHAETYAKLATDENVIISGEFGPEHQDWLYTVRRQYGYELFIVRCRETDFDEAYTLYESMIRNVTEYDKPRFAEKYIYNTLYIPSVVVDDVLKDLWAFSYDADMCTKVTGDKVIKDVDFMQEVE